MTLALETQGGFTYSTDLILVRLFLGCIRYNKRDFGMFYFSCLPFLLSLLSAVAQAYSLLWVSTVGRGGRMVSENQGRLLVGVESIKEVRDKKRVEVSCEV